MDIDDLIAQLRDELEEFKASLEPAAAEAQLRVPDIVEFMHSDDYLGLDDLFPDQMLQLKLATGQTHLLTTEDLADLDRFSRGFTLETSERDGLPRYTGENGIVPDILERIRIWKAEGRSWFRQIVWPWGRRAGKGHLAACLALYVLWNLMALGDLRKEFVIRRGKTITVGLFSASRDQAIATIWADLVGIAAHAPCFAPWITEIRRGTMRIATPYDLANPTPGSKGSLEVTAFASNGVEARGRPMVVQIYDEMAFVTAADSKAPAEVIYDAMVPCTDQFRNWSMILATSSPWQRTGKFYGLAQEALELHPVTGAPAYPTSYLSQFTAWDLYEGWDTAHLRAMVPDEVAQLNPFHKGPDGRARTYPKIVSPIQTYDDEMRREQERDPIKFAVERMAQWADVANPAFDRHYIAQLWTYPDGTPVPIGTSTPLNRSSHLHLDLAFIGDNTAWAIGYSHRPEGDTLTRLQVQRTRHIVPRNCPGGRLESEDLIPLLVDDIVRYGVKTVTLDQHNGRAFASLLRAAPGLPSGVTVTVIDHSVPLNKELLEWFRDALFNGLIDAPYDRQLEDELRFAMVINDKLQAPTTGPVTTDDSVIALMVLYHELCPESVPGDELAALNLVGTDIRLSEDPIADLGNFGREGLLRRNFRC